MGQGWEHQISLSLTRVIWVLVAWLPKEENEREREREREREKKISL